MKILKFINDYYAYIVVTGLALTACTSIILMGREIEQVRTKYDQLLKDHSMLQNKHIALQKDYMQLYIEHDNITEKANACATNVTVMDLELFRHIQKLLAK